MQHPLNHQLTHLAAVVDMDRLDASTVERAPVIVQARRIARCTRSALTLLCFQSPPSLLTSLQSLVAGGDFEGEQMAVREALSGVVRRIEQEDGISVRCEGLQTAFDPATLIDRLTAQATDLLVLSKPDQREPAAVGMSGLSRLIRRTGLPVWFVQASSRPQDGVIAALAEGSENGSAELRALDYEVMDTARGVSRLFGARLHIVQARERKQPSVGSLNPAVTGQLDGANAGTGFPSAEAGGAAERLVSGRRALRSFARATGAGDDVDQVVVGVGATAPVVADRAEDLNAGLIIMGAREKSSWETLLKGGTAESALGKANCDVLYVKNTEGEHIRPHALLAHSALVAEPETSQVDLIVQPRRYFATPLSVLRDHRLSRLTKVLILETWEEELHNEIVHEARMPQQVYEVTTGPEELETVHQALIRLGAESEAA